MAISGAVPEWTLADRLRKAREYAGLYQSDMADEIEVARRSIGNWESGVSRPRRPILIAWALRCGVDYSWLATGQPGPGGPPTSDNPGTTTPDAVTTRRYLEVSA